MVRVKLISHNMASQKSYLQVNDPHRFVDRGNPKQRVQVAHRVPDLHRLLAPEPRKQPLLPITRTGQRIVGSIRNRIRARGIVVEVGQDRRKCHHLHGVGIALSTKLVDGFGDGGEGLGEEEFLMGG